MSEERGASGVGFATGGGRLIDTHCHLDMLEYPVAEALEEADRAGVGGVITVGIDGPSSRRAVELAESHATVAEGLPVWATVGLHPHDAQQWDEELAAELGDLARRPLVVAIGECGLDYYRDLSPRNAQKRAFIGQLQLARAAGKPVVVHVRDAADDALELLAEHGADLHVVLHCFSAPQTLTECVRRGYVISFAGNVTYKNAADLRAAAREVPDELLLVETDAPFLTPVPYRGRTNLPGLVVHTAALIAEVRGQDGRELADLTSSNAARVFGLGAS